MATWPVEPVGAPAPGGTAVLIPDVSGPLSRRDRWVVVGAGNWADRLDRRDGGSTDGPIDASSPDPPSDTTPTRPAQALLRRDAAGVAICDVLAAWRATERELAGLSAGDRRASLLEAEIRGLRDLHHRLFVARARPVSSSLGIRSIPWSAGIGDWLALSTRRMTR